LAKNPTYRVERHVIINFDLLGTAFSEALSTVSFNGCSDLNFSNQRRLSVALPQVLFTSDFSAHKRACGDWPWPFHGGWQTDLASATGNVVESIGADLTAPTIDYSSPGSVASAIDRPVVNISRADLLGFIDPNSVAGQILEFTLRIDELGIDAASFRTINAGFTDLINEVKATNYGIAVPSAMIAYANSFSQSFSSIDKAEGFSGDVVPLFVDTSKSGFVANGRGTFYCTHRERFSLTF
jgi:hypothetical protein